MRKDSILLVFISLLLLFLTSCATVQTETGSDPDQPVIAQKLPQVMLETARIHAAKGKLTRLENGAVTFLPFPYWNVESIEVPVDDIITVEVERTGSNTLRGAFYGFMGGVFFTGLLGAGLSQYNTDYQFWLRASVETGAASGLVGMGIGLISDISTRYVYQFDDMSAEEKDASLRTIMGVR